MPYSECRKQVYTTDCTAYTRLSQFLTLPQLPPCWKLILLGSTTISMLYWDIWQVYVAIKLHQMTTWIKSRIFSNTLGLELQRRWHRRHSLSGSVFWVGVVTTVRIVMALQMRPGQLTQGKWIGSQMLFLVVWTCFLSRVVERPLQLEFWPLLRG